MADDFCSQRMGYVCEMSRNRRFDLVGMSFFLVAEATMLGTSGQRKSVVGRFLRVSSSFS